MAETRIVKTKVWGDDWFHALPVEARYLYLFLLTNKITQISGYYELGLREMEFYTSIKVEKLVKLLPLLEPKVFYQDGWVIIKNYPKHQNVANNSKVQQSIDKALVEVPDALLKLNHKSEIINHKSETIDSLSIPSKSEEKGVNKKGTVDKSGDDEKKAYGQFKNVKLTDREKNDLKERYGHSAAKELVIQLDLYLESTGKKQKYKSHHATLLNWARRARLEMLPKPTIQEPEPEISPEQDERNRLAIQRMKEELSKKFKTPAS